MTLSVNVSLFDLSRNKDDRKFVQDLLDALTSYEEAEGQEVVRPLEDPIGSAGASGPPEAPSAGSLNRLISCIF